MGWGQKGWGPKGWKPRRVEGPKFRAHRPTPRHPSSPSRMPTIDRGQVGETGQNRSWPKEVAPDSAASLLFLLWFLRPPTITTITKRDLPKCGQQFFTVDWSPLHAGPHLGLNFSFFPVVDGSFFCFCFTVTLCLLFVSLLLPLLDH